MNYNEHTLLQMVFDTKNQVFQFAIFGKKMLGSCLTAWIGKRRAIMELLQFNRYEKPGDLLEEWKLLCRDPDLPERQFQISIAIYADHAIFSTHYDQPLAGKKKKHPFGHPYISFPCFEGENWEDDLAMLSFKRQAPFNYPVQWFGRVTDSIRSGKNLPLIIIDQNYQTIVISPLTHLLHGTVSISHTPQSVRCGIPRSAPEIPAGACSQTLMVFGCGVNATLDAWGNILRQHYQIAPVKPDADVLLQKISYWTNAGSAYWYNSYRKTSYETTFKKLRQHHKAIQLPIGSYQLDSWWYERENDSYTAPITRWELKKTTLRKNHNSLLSLVREGTPLALFSESRMDKVVQLLEHPIGVHFKQLSNEAPYVKEHPEDFILDEFALPINEKAGEIFFRHLFNQPAWRLSFVIHDWLQWMNDRHPGFRDLQVADDYFKALDRALLSILSRDNQCGHITLVLCMTQPHMTLRSASMRSVTVIRSTADAASFFIEGAVRWRWHLYSSRFIQALGKFSFFDNRKSRGRSLMPYSANPAMEMIWMSLSGGPIALGDPIGKENMELIRKVVLKDGDIIKPDHYAVPLDQCYLYNPCEMKAKKGVVVYACKHAKLPDGDREMRVLYLLSMNMHPLRRKVSVTYSISEASGIGLYAILNYGTGDIRIVRSDESILVTLCGRKYVYQIAAPLVKGVALFGDVSKYVSCSRKLIHNVVIERKYVILKGVFSGNSISEWLFYSENSYTSCTLNGKKIPMTVTGSKIRIRTTTVEEGIYELVIKNVSE